MQVEMQVEMQVDLQAISLHYSVSLLITVHVPAIQTHRQACALTRSVGSTGSSTDCAAHSLVEAAHAVMAQEGEVEELHFRCAGFLPLPHQLSALSLSPHIAVR